MKLLHLDLVQFKNQSKIEYIFNEKRNFISGNNGRGKTNILDAILYLTQGKSYFNHINTQLIEREKDFFNIRGKLMDNQSNSYIELFSALMLGKSRVIKENDVKVSKITDFYGKYPVVMIAPQDVSLLNEGGETRRNWMDGVISLYDKEYLLSIIRYNKLLAQRNSLLKQCVDSQFIDTDLLNIYHQQLLPESNLIFTKRNEFVKHIQQILNDLYKTFSNGLESTDLQYDSQLHNQSIVDLWEGSLTKDKLLGRTTKGIHRDDVQFIINDFNVKRFASQGQLKTYLFALKLSAVLLVTQMTNNKPIILLDDFSERLDKQRIKLVADYLVNQLDNQLFITDTDTQKMIQLFGDKGEFINL